MRPHTEAKIARLSESEAVSFGPLAHYNKLTGDTSTGVARDITKLLGRQSVGV